MLSSTLAVLMKSEADPEAWITAHMDEVEAAVITDTTTTITTTIYRLPPLPPAPKERNIENHDALLIV